MLGLKSWSHHKQVTGQEIDATLQFARRLAARRKPVWIRFVLVPGLTDSPSEMADMATFAAGLGNVERVEVLPFHQMGRYKWDRLGVDYTLANTQPPTTAAIEEACAIWRAGGLYVV